MLTNGRAVHFGCSASHLGVPITQGCYCLQLSRSALERGGARRAGGRRQAAAQPTRQPAYTAAQRSQQGDGRACGGTRGGGDSRLLWCWCGRGDGCR